MRHSYLLNSLLGFFLLTLLFSCKDDSKKATTTVVEKKPAVKIPVFNQDSAYAFIEKQLSFGTRVPGSEGHKACKKWMVSKFKSYGADVIEQDFIAQVYTGESLESTNIIAQFNPKHKDRIILSAHWDTRFIGEEDNDKNLKDKPIPGADDGGSGTGVLIEVARQLQANPIDYGIDIILWDAEDQGSRGSSQPTWCLGSQYWSRNKHTKKYRPKYGINLDMIGAKNPRFGQDVFSRQYAGQALDKVWKLAKNMGYSDMFVNVDTGQLTDDHFYVNTMGGIPMIDIINQPHNSTTGFMHAWHTHDDDISVIDKRSLRVVGQVVTAVIYKESDGSI